MGQNDFFVQPTETYKIDPISLMGYSDDKLLQIIKDLAEQADIYGLDNSVDVTHKTVLYSGVQTVLAELLARAELIYEDSKADFVSKKALEIQRLRTVWKDENPGNNRPPASDFFDDLALATITILELNKQMNKNKTTLTRYRRFFTNFETRINALKKLSERMSNLEPKLF